MAIFHMFPQVAPISACLSTQSAFADAGPTGGVLGNIFVQLSVSQACKHQFRQDLFLETGVGILMEGSDMVVEVGPRGESLAAMFAGTAEGIWEMDIFHMLPQIAPVPADLATDSAAVAVWAFPHYVLVQLLVTCNQQESDLV